MTPPSIGVGVPVWRGAAFVAETLECILSQRDVSIDVFVSIDGDDRDSEHACRAFASDPRLRIVVQPHRLGWVKNSAAAIAGAGMKGVRFVCLQPHDDLIAPDYLRTLFDVACKNPQAAVVYSDILAFGTMDGALTQRDIIGTAVERQVTLLAEHFNAVAYRGLVPTSALARVPPMSGNRCNDFACDTVWMARLARVGDLIRVPLPLYRKRFHSANTHSSWMAWPPAQKVEAWLQHCLDMLAEALIVCEGERDRSRVVAAARSRLVHQPGGLAPFGAEIYRLDEAALRRLQRNFDDACCTRFNIEPE